MEKSEQASNSGDGDVEKQASNDGPAPTIEPKEEPKDPNLVEFDGPDDPGNPRTRPSSPTCIRL